MSLMSLRGVRDLVCHRLYSSSVVREKYLITA
jgi:hypothetical protein